MTFELSSTASCHYRHMLLHFIELDFFHLRRLCPAVRSTRITAAKTAVQVFICCRLDYCNSMLYSMSDGLLWKVQSIQNAPHVWSQELDDATASRRCCVSCIGCLSVNESSTRLHAWYTIASWSDTRIHSRRRPTRYGEWSQSATSFSRRRNMPRSVVPRTHNNFI